MRGRAWAAGLLFALLIVFSLTGAAQTAPATPNTPAGATVRGHIADPSGAMIPGAKVTIANALGVTVTSTQADASGVYVVGNLPAGSYIVEANVNGFAPFTSPTIQIAAGQYKRVDISMAILAEQQNVVVSDDEGPHVSVEADSNASSIVLKDKDLDALSDDPDELQNELTALAGPSAGPNGGQIYIDGFTGGTLPPKSAIREIRINQNPFSAEFDRIGYGRIEILTKPGTDKFHARGFIQGNDDAFNTGNPFTKSSQIPAYHSIQYNANVSGALSKTASFFMTVEGRNTQDATIYSAYEPVLANGVYTVTPVSGGLFNPSSRIEISPRLDIQLGQKNTVTARFQYEHGSSTNSGTGSTTLPSAAYNSNSSEFALQVSDSILINDRMATEFRAQFRRGVSSTTPVSSAPTIGVTGYFSGGGYSGQYSSDHSDHMELQNTTTISAGAQAIKVGFWLRDNREASYSDSNFNGSFTFSSLSDYASTLNWIEDPANYSQAINKLTYSTSPSGKLTYRANVFDAAAFLQDDWKKNRFLTLSGGLRLEMQNHTNDHIDIAPRIAFAYALDGHKKGTQGKTVLRGGFGFFYDRFGVSSLMGLERNNGDANSIQQTVVNAPTCAHASSLSSITLSSCGSGSNSTSQVQALQSNYRSPYNEQVGVSIERQLTKTTTMTGTYVHTFGVHQTATINANPYAAATGSTYYNSSTGSRLNADEGIVDEIYPEAVFKQNQMIVNVNARISPRLSMMGFYNLGFANGNTGTASNSYNLSQDYGRTSFQRRNMLFMMGSYSGAWGISYNPFLVVQSGHPYNIVTNTDQTGDNFFNNRPAYADAASCAATNTSNTGRYVQTRYGCMDVTPAQGEALIPVNLADGPAAIAVNLRVNRSFGIGPKTGQAAAGNDPRRQQQGSYMSGPGGGPGGGGGRGPGGGGHGGPGGGSNNTGRKYALTFSAAAMNLFNNIDYGTPSGSIVPTALGNNVYGPGQRFGKSTSLAGGMFASPSNSAARRIFFQAAFTF